MTDSDSKGWIRSAPYDLLFVANVAWPLLLIPGLSSSSETAIDFWQVYFLTLPHRWLTLFLVAIDPDRRVNIAFPLTAMAILFAAVIGGVYIGSNAFLCLGVIDYLWNGWHFASQHAGVLRIYSKKSGGGIPFLERWGMRTMITYVIFRTANSMTYASWFPSPPANLLLWIDLIVMLIPMALLLTNLTHWHFHRTPKIIYLLSVLLLYSGYLLSFRWMNPAWILCFATAASLFHAVEYLAIVSHYAMRRGTSGSPGWMRWMSPRWPLILVSFMLLLGSFSLWINQRSIELTLAWQGLNLWAAFTHYAWDGLIWKLRRAETAQALGAT